MKNTHARVMVLVHDTSSQCALQMYEVSLKYNVSETVNNGVPFYFLFPIYGYPKFIFGYP